MPGRPFVRPGMCSGSTAIERRYLLQRLTINSQSGAEVHAMSTTCSRKRLHQTIGDLRSFGEEARDGGLRGRRARVVGAAVAAIAIVETARQLGSTQGRRTLGVHQLAHAIAPGLAIVGPAQFAQVVDGAQYL